MSDIYAELAKVPAHNAACVAAIASIGGDPATVGELVAAVRRVVVIAEDDILDSGTAIISALDDLSAVLAKLPENSNG